MANMPQPFPPPPGANANPTQVATIPQNTQLSTDLQSQSYVGGGYPSIRIMPASANANASINSISQTVTENVTNVVIPTIPPPTFGQITTGQNMIATMIVGSNSFLGYANFFVNGGVVGNTAFIQGEPVIQSGSGATSVIAAFFNNQIQLGPIVGSPNSTGTWTGQVSGALYVPNALPAASTGVINASEVGTINVSGSVPAHAGQLLISQPGNTTAVWADPMVQGLFPPGTNTSTGNSGNPINPVMIGGSDYAGTPLLHDWKVDSSGFGYVNATLAGGSIVVTQGTTPWVDDITQWANTTLGAPTAFAGTSPSGNVIGVNAAVYVGTSALAFGQQHMASSIPVVLADNQSAIPVSQSGSWSVSISGTVSVQQASFPWNVAGNIASGSADSGNPVKVGAVYNSTQPTFASGQRTDLQSTSRGAVIVATGADGFNVTNAGTFAVQAAQSGVWTVLAQQSTTPWVTQDKADGAPNTTSQPTQAIQIAGWEAGAGKLRVANMDLNGNLGVNVENTVTVEALQDGTWIVQGGLSNNTSAPIADNMGVLPALCGSAAPTWTSGNQTFLSVDTSGNLRVTVPGSISVTQGTSPWVTQDAADATVVGGVGTASGKAIGVSGLYQTTLPAPTNGQQVEFEVDQSGNLLHFPGVQTKVGTAWTSSSSGFLYPTGTNVVGQPLGGEAVLIQLVQTSTITGGQVTFQGTYDNVNWVSIPVAQILDPNTFAQQTNPYTFVANTNKAFLIVLQGYQNIRLNLSTGITGTGSVTPYFNVLAVVPYGTTAITGTVGVTQSTSPWVDNISQIGGTNVLSGGVNGLFPQGWYGTQNTSAASWTSSTTVNTTVLLLNNVTSYANILVTLNQAPTGSLTGGAVTFEASNDNSNWFPVQGVNLAVTAVAGAIFALNPATYSAIQFSLAAPYFRVRLSTVITGTGTVTVGYALGTAPDIALLVTGTGLTGSVSISGFTAALPTGSNLIGQVEVSDGTNVILTNAHPAYVTTNSNWPDNLLQVASTNLGTPQTFGTAPTGVVIGTSSDIYVAGTRARSNQTTTAAGVLDNNIVGIAGTTVNTAAAGTILVGLADGTGHAITSDARGSARPLAVEILDGSGNQITTFGGGTQYADNAASGATPTGTLSMLWDSANSKVRAAKCDSNQYLNVDVQTWNAGSLSVTGSGLFSVQGADAAGAGNAHNPLKIGGVFNTTQPSYANGTITELQATSRGAVIVATGVDAFNVVGNITQFGGSNVVTGTGASGAGIPRVTVSNDSQVKVWDGTNTATVKAANTGAVANDTSIVTTLSPQSGIPLSTPKANNVATSSKVATCSSVVVGAHQTIIVTVSSGNWAATNWSAAVSDTVNTYVNDVSINNSTTGYAAVFRATNVAAGTLTIQFVISGTNSANTTVSMEVYVVDGLLSSPLDQTATNTASSTSVTTSTVYPQGPNEYAFMAIAAPAAETSITAGGAWTADFTHNDSVCSFASLSQLLPAMNGVSGAATLASSAAYAAALATYRTPAENIEGTVQLEANGQMATIKAASTAAVDGDTSLVVQLNPKQPQLDTALNVAIPANSSVNVNQFGGNAVVTGTGAGGSGIPRVTVSNDSAVKIWDGTTVAGVISGTTALKIDVSSVAGTATSTAASGVMKVGVVGNAAAAFDAATGAAPAANIIQTGGLIYTTALPSAGSTGNNVQAACDKFGRQIVEIGTTRDLVKTAAVQTTDASSHNLLAAQGSGVFADLKFLMITNETATATVVSLSDGTTTYKFSIAAAIGAGGAIPLPAEGLPAASSNTAWTVQGSATATLDFVAVFDLNK